MCIVAMLAGLLAAVAPPAQAQTPAASEASLWDTTPLSRRQLLQNIDPLSSSLRTTMCVNDTTVLPFRAIGKIVSETQSGGHRCMGVLIGPDAVLTPGVCLDDDSSANFLFGGSQCSEKTDDFRTIKVTSVYKPSTPSFCSNNYNALCRQ